MFNQVAIRDCSAREDEERRKTVESSVQTEASDGQRLLRTEKNISDLVDSLTLVERVKLQSEELKSENVDHIVNQYQIVNKSENVEHIVHHIMNKSEKVNDIDDQIKQVEQEKTEIEEKIKFFDERSKIELDQSFRNSPRHLQKTETLQENIVTDVDQDYTKSQANERNTETLEEIDQIYLDRSYRNTPRNRQTLSSQSSSKLKIGFQCHKCGFKTSQHTHLRVHMVDKHPRDQNLDTTGQSLDRRGKSRSKGDSFVGESSQSLDRRGQCLSRQHQGNPMRSLCGMCQVASDKTCDLNEYMETRSLDESCQLCSFEYPQIPTTKYVRTSFVATFECEKCEFSTTQKRDLQKHIKDVHGWLEGWLFN